MTVSMVWLSVSSDALALFSWEIILVGSFVSNSLSMVLSIK